MVAPKKNAQKLRESSGLSFLVALGDPCVDVEKSKHTVRVMSWLAANASKSKRVFRSRLISDSS